MKWLIPLLLLLPFPTNAVEDDKGKHLAASVAIGGAAEWYFEDYATSMAICAGIGVAKEVYDEIDYGGFDAEDLAYDIVGCAIGVAIPNMSVTEWNDATMLTYKIEF